MLVAGVCDYSLQNKWTNTLLETVLTAHERIDVITTKPQVIDYPYPTTNILPLTTHHTLIVVRHCVIYVHVMMIGMQRKMIANLTFPCQTI